MRIWVQVVHLGVDPRKHQQGNGEWDSEEKKANKKCTIKQVTTVVNWSSETVDPSLLNVKEKGRELLPRWFQCSPNWDGRVNHMPSQGLFQSYDYMIAHYWKLAGNWFDTERSGCEGDCTTFGFHSKERCVYPSHISERTF